MEPRFGAELSADGVEFAVWAPARRDVAVELRGDAEHQAPVALERREDGWFRGSVAGLRAGARYLFRLDDDPKGYPDPASRSQPEGPHGPSEVVDPKAFAWRTPRRGATREGQVVYELHVGTFTREGTWAAAAGELPRLAALGVTLLEVMPVHAFAGTFGWGYDGVCLYAPTHVYGTPDDFRRFVDVAHEAGLGVILDVVYNHLGPSGNYLPQFAKAWFSEKHTTEWGDALNFDGPGSEPVRAFFVENAAYWVREFRLDGLRFDATQSIFDDESHGRHVLAEMTDAARAAAAGTPIFLVAENEPQHTRLARPVEHGGFGFDALWNDDYHHTLIVALTGQNHAYYTDYAGSPQELVSALRWGYLYQGQRYSWQKKRRGTPGLDLPAGAFVTYIENHDQVANSPRGRRPRLDAKPGVHRALVALTLLAPPTPMLFQGEEVGADQPFHYFADHEPDLAKLVREGRAEFTKQFPRASTPDVTAILPDPGDRKTFEACKLDFAASAAAHPEVVRLYRDLLALRRDDPVLSRSRNDRTHGAVLGPATFLLRFFADADAETETDRHGHGHGHGHEPAHGHEQAHDRLLLVNLGADRTLTIAPEPLLAPPDGCSWELAWSSESVAYGGSGAPPLEGDFNWRLVASSTALMIARPKTQGG